SCVVRIPAPRPIRSAASGMRGFFLAEIEELSLLALVDQFAEEGPPGGDKMFRVIGGNDRIAAQVAAPLGERLRLNTMLKAVSQSPNGVRVSLEHAGVLAQMEAD